MKMICFFVDGFPFSSSGSGFFFGPKPLLSFDTIMNVMLLKYIDSFLLTVLKSKFSLSLEEKTQRYRNTARR